MASEQKHEMEQQEDQDEEETETEQITDDEQHHQEGGAAAAGKKKKKRKKKKKPAGAAAESAAGSTSTSSSGGDGEAGAAAGEPAAAGVGSKPADKQEADRRFQKALDSAKHGEDMWVLLADANLHDAKVKKLFEALRSNSSITSVNLSANHIGNEGVQALVSVLQQGGCSELIDLDLRGNSLSPEAEALLGDLCKARKQLAVSTGPLPPPEPEGGSSSGSDRHSGGGRGRGSRGGRAGAAGGRGAAAEAAAAAAAAEQQGPQGQHPVFTQSSLKELAKTSPMFRRYFQIADEEADEGSSGDEEAEQVEQLPAPEEVWGKVCELLPQGASSIPELSAALVIISRALDAEMASMPAHEEEAQLESFQPHFRAVIQHLPQLQQVLQLQPPPKEHQSSGAPQPAVGSHRVWGAGILHMLLLHNNPVMDRAVADAGLLPVVVALALQHDRCSAVQCRAVEALRCSLQSSVPELWQCLFTEGFGRRLQQPGRSDGTLMPPLHKVLVEIASTTTEQPVGKRPCGVGFAAEVANTLLQSSDGSSGAEQLCAPLAVLLEGCPLWRGSIAPGGPIHRLLQEQDGQLCGPPPPRPAPSMDSMEEGDSIEPSLQLMNGNQIMALLSCMGELS